MGNTIDTKNSDLLMLRMEAQAIRDQALLNLNALIARIDLLLPPVDPERYRPKTAAQYKAERAAMRMKQ